MHIRVNNKIQHEPCSLRADFFTRQDKPDFFAGGIKVEEGICCDTEWSQKSHHVHQGRFHIQILSIFFKELLSVKNNVWFEVSLQDLLWQPITGTV